MYRFSLFSLAVVAMLITLPSDVKAVTTTWTGTTSDLTDSSNWDSGVPTEGDQGDFTGSGDTTPTLSMSSMSNDFIIQLVNFPVGAQAYTFKIFSEDSQFTFEGNSVGLAAPGGVLNQSSNVQNFNVYDSASLLFNNVCTALDPSSISSATYAIGDSMSETPGTLIFNDNSSVGSSLTNITATNGSSVIFKDQAAAGGTIALTGTGDAQPGPGIAFRDTATAQDASITLTDVSFLAFEDASHANTALIDSTSSHVLFTGSSHADAAIINADVHTITSFENNSNADSATINLGNTSLAELFAQDTAGLGSSAVTAINDSTIFLLNLSSAQSSQIQLGAISPASAGELRIFDSSNAGTSNVYAVSGSNIIFGNYAKANFSSIHLGEDINNNIDMTNSASLLFKDSSDAEFSNITAHGPSDIVFQDSSNANQSNITLEDTSILAFIDNSSSSAAQINVGTTASVTFLQAGDDVFSGSLTGSGSVQKTGTGKLTISSDNSSFLGTTSITNGRLALNGLLGGSVFVSSAGILSGNGTVVGSLDVNNGGTIAPGNSIGTLFVNGTYAQSNSTYLVQVDNQGHASLIDVIGGTATLGAGASVNVLPLFTQLTAGQVFTVPILHADGGLTGEFSTLTTSNPLVAFRLTYDHNNAYLTYQNALALNAFTFNEQQVANQLITITSPTAEETAVLTALVGLAPNNQAAALAQMNAQQYATLLITAEDTNRRFIRRLYDPLRSIITAAPCMRKPRCCPRDNTTWFTASWEGSAYKGNCNAQGFKSNGFEVSIGAQTHCEDWTLGVAGTYEWDHYHYNIGGAGNSNTGLGALYALYRPSCYYALADLVLGGSSQKITRPIDVGSFHFTKHGRPTMFQGTLYTEAGFDCYWDSLLVQPFLGFEFGYYNRDSIHEHSDDTFLDVNVNQTSRGIVNSRLGLHMSNQWMSCWTLAVDVAWQYRLTPLANKIEESFTTFGSDFQIKGVPVARSSFDTVINLSYAVDDSWRIYAEAAGQRWTNSSFYSVLGGIEFSW